MQCQEGQAGGCKGHAGGSEGLTGHSTHLGFPWECTHGQQHPDLASRWQHVQPSTPAPGNCTQEPVATSPLCKPRRAEKEALLQWSLPAHLLAYWSFGANNAPWSISAMYGLPGVDAALQGPHLCT